MPAKAKAKAASSLPALTYEALAEQVRAFWPARLVLTAVELGVADVLAGRELAADEAARALGCDARATALLLNALVPVGLVVKTGERYRNSAMAEERLVSTSPAYGGGGLLHSANLWKAWSGLTEVLRTGRPAKVESDRSEAQYRNFVRAMYDYNWGRAQALAAELDLGSARRLLDLGGGPGSFAIAFVQRNPGLAAVVFDRPQALPVARELVARHGVADRVDLVPGDFLEDPLGEGFDCVFASAIIHSYGEEDVRRILKKSFDALVPGGRLLVQEFFLDDDRTSPPHAALFALNMLVNTEQGRTYTWSEVSTWLREAGFEDVGRVREREGAGLLGGRRPGRR